MTEIVGRGKDDNQPNKDARAIELQEIADEIARIRAHIGVMSRVEVGFALAHLESLESRAEQLVKEIFNL